VLRLIQQRGVDGHIVGAIHRPIDNQFPRHEFATAAERRQSVATAAGRG
jgi:hypothetical protein